jgi:hypothetical protein
LYGGRTTFAQITQRPGPAASRTASIEAWKLDTALGSSFVPRLTTSTGGSFEVPRISLTPSSVGRPV